MSIEEKVATFDDVSLRGTQETSPSAHEENTLEPVDALQEVQEAEGDVFWEGDEDAEGDVIYVEEEYIDDGEEGDQGVEVKYRDEVTAEEGGSADEVEATYELVGAVEDIREIEDIRDVISADKRNPGSNVQEIKTTVSSQPPLLTGHKRRREERRDGPEDSVSHRRSTEHERARDEDCRNRRKFDSTASQDNQRRESDRSTSRSDLNETDRVLRSREGLLQESVSLRHTSRREDEGRSKGENHKLPPRDMRRSDEGARPEERREIQNSQGREMRERPLEREGGNQRISSRRFPSPNHQRPRSRERGDTADSSHQIRNSRERRPNELKRASRERSGRGNRSRSPRVPEGRTRARPPSKFSAVPASSAKTPLIATSSSSPSYSERTCAIGVGPVTDDKSALALFKALLASNSSRDVQCRSAAVSWIEALKVYLHAIDHPSNSGESAVQQALPAATTAISLLKTITGKACSPDAVARAEATVMAATFLFQSPLRNPQPLPASFLAAWYDSSLIATPSNSCISDSRADRRSHSPEPKEPKARSHWTTITTKTGRVRESVRGEDLEFAPRHQPVSRQRLSETHLPIKMAPKQDEPNPQEFTSSSTPPMEPSTGEQLSGRVESSDSTPASNTSVSATGGRVALPSATGNI